MVAFTACVPTFDEVEPLFESECMSCHGANGPARPTLDAAGLSQWAEPAANAVSSGRMPPWLPTSDGLPLQRSLDLEPDERRLLTSWLKAGAPVPDDATLEAPAALPFEYDVEIEIPRHPVHDEQWRCFIIDSDPNLITGFQVEASDSVHHVLVGNFAADHATAFTTLDAADSERGWSCPDLFMPASTHPPDSIPVYWFPDPRPTYTWSGTASPMEGLTVLQVHGLGNGEASGTLRIQTDPEATPERVVSLGTGEVDLPPDEETVIVTRRGYLRDFSGTDERFHVLGARGHGHEQLVSLNIDIDGERILALDDWDPAFQSRYLLAEPFPVGPNAVVTLTCTYDNSQDARRRAATYGNGREMCGGWLFGTESDQSAHIR